MKYIVLDDEKGFVDSFAEIVARLRPDAQVVGFESERGLFEYLSDQAVKPDGVFIDIRLNDSSGIDIARQISTLIPLVPVIFVTGYPLEYCQNVFIDDFEIEPFAFICKPVDERVLSRVLEKLELRNSSDDSTVSLRSGRKYVIVKTGEVTYIESDRWSVIVHTYTGNVSVRGKMSDVLSLFPDKFIAAHKSYAVNADHVRSFDNVSVTLDDSTVLPVSRSRKNEFRQQILALRGFER